jgi:trimeric autotransporter adhesin
VVNSSNIYNNGGNVGIGTTSPTNKFQVNDGNLALTNDNNTASILYFYEPSTSGSNYMAFKAQNMTANVTYTLPAADGTSGQVLSTNGSGTLSWSTGTGWGLSGNAAGSSNFIGTTGNKSFRVRTNNTERVTVDSLGNVGIGTTTTGTGLWVFDNYSGKNVITIENTNSAGFSSMDFLSNTGALSATFGFANSGSGSFFTNSA